MVCVKKHTNCDCYIIEIAILHIKNWTADKKYCSYQISSVFVGMDEVSIHNLVSLNFYVKWVGTRWFQLVNVIHQSPWENVSTINFIKSCVFK